jgi:hypothetical protein
MAEDVTVGRLELLGRRAFIPDIENIQKAGLRIRIRRIRMLLGLPDPDSLVRSTDPAPDPDHQANIVRNTFFLLLCDVFTTFYL